MKKGILLTSLGAAGLATVIGGLSIYGGGPSAGLLATVTGLFSMVAFLVGSAYPADVIETSTFDATSQTRKVSNS